MNLNPFSRRRRSLQPRGDVLRRLDETGNPVSEPESPPTGTTNWPVIGFTMVSSKGVLGKVSGPPSSIPQLTAPGDPSAVRRPGIVEVIATAGQLFPTPKPPKDLCPRCHHPVPGGHMSDCAHWRFLGVVPDDD